MFEFHENKVRYFEMQREDSAMYVVPFIQAKMELNKEVHVLEVGCAEGGVLKSFTDLGCTGVGVELVEGRFELAKEFLEKEIKGGQVEIHSCNVYDVQEDPHFKEKFNLIILKDVIEHIPNQKELLKCLKGFLKPGGQIFFGFPPWYMPFGGHQQICKNKFLSILPYYHILPKFIYKGILSLFKEPESVVKELLEIKDTRITIGQFKQYAKANALKITNELFYLINPIYKYKFGLKPRKQLPLIGKIPILRNFVTTCAYFLVKKES